MRWRRERRTPARSPGTPRTSQNRILCMRVAGRTARPAAAPSRQGGLSPVCALGASTALTLRNELCHAPGGRRWQMAMTADSRWPPEGEPRRAMPWYWPVPVPPVRGSGRWARAGRAAVRRLSALTPLTRHHARQSRSWAAARRQSPAWPDGSGRAPAPWIRPCHRRPASRSAPRGQVSRPVVLTRYRRRSTW